MNLMLKTERNDEGGWRLIMLARDGIWDILSDHPTRAAAKLAMISERESYFASLQAERAERLLSAE